MTPQTKERLLAHVVRLLEEGKAVISTQTTPKGTFEPGFVVIPGSPYVDQQKLSKWLTGCRNVVHQIGAPAAAWADGFEQPKFHSLAATKNALGNLEALSEALEHNALVPVESLVFADAFGSLLEQADELLSKGFTLAAGVLGRAVLEEHLRKMCDRGNCLPPRRSTINDLNQALYQSQRIDKLAMQGVIAMATAGNHCAHNSQPPLAPQDIQKLLDDIRGFLVRHPLS